MLAESADRSDSKQPGPQDDRPCQEGRRRPGLKPHVTFELFWLTVRAIPSGG